MSSRTPKKAEAHAEAQKSSPIELLASVAIFWGVAALGCGVLGFIGHSLWSAARLGWLLFARLMQW